MISVFKMLANGIRYTGDGIVALAARDAKIMDYFRNEYKKDADAAYIHYMSTGSLNFPNAR